MLESQESNTGAPRSPEAYVPNGLVLEAVAKSMEMENASLEDIARRYVQSIDFSRDTLKGETGDPSDMLPAGVPADEFERWARTTSGETIH